MTVQSGLKAGKISKPYGLQGDVHIILLPAVAQILKAGNPLFIDLDGQRVPFFMETLERLSEEEAIVKFEFISSVEEARKISGREVFLDLRDSGGLKDPEGITSQLMGYRVMDLKLGEIGKITDYIPGSMNPVWVIEKAGNEMMIPATRDFIQKIDPEKEIVFLDLPEGLTEL